MALMFYPHSDDVVRGSLEERLDALMEGALRYKAIILDEQSKAPEVVDPNKRMVPRDLTVAYNWEEIARLLRDIRELIESSTAAKQRKAKLLRKMAEIYEILRATKMTKLEAVRLALMNEASQLDNLKS